MTKRVLEIGNCNLDHTLLSVLLNRNFQAAVIRAHDAAEALAALRSGPFDLVLVNRLLDRDGSEGLGLIRTIKASPEFAATPVMMITNYPEHQERAVAAGAELGFGKAELQAAETHEKLARFLAK
jgi:CheY-like chemotaxis protein